MTRMNALLGDSPTGHITMQAMMGGSISALSGGSFQNGAMTAAFAHLFNELQHTNFPGANAVFSADTNCSHTQRCVAAVKEYEGPVPGLAKLLGISKTKALGLTMGGEYFIWTTCGALTTDLCKNEEVVNKWPENSQQQH